MRFVLMAVPYLIGRHEDVQLAGSDRGRFQILMNRLREQVQLAEVLGFDGFCMSEHHMQVEGIEATTNPLMWNYFVAQHTKTMRVGQLGMNLTVVNPIKLAEDIAMLDHFTNGRVFAGFSRGNTPRWTNTFGQHVNVTSAESDKSEADQRNRAIFYENWRIVKELWTKPTTSVQGEFWKVPVPTEWRFGPTDKFGVGTVSEDKMLKEVGIVPRPLQEPHPPVYAPFSQSMETARFWAREGGKMVAFISNEFEHFIPIVLKEYIAEAARVGRTVTPGQALGIGAHLTLGRNQAESDDLERGFRELWSFAYDAPPYHAPVGRIWGGSKQAVKDDIARLRDTYGIDEFFVWHHIGYFPQEVEMAALQEFADAVM
jgi:alkanesulfonate monooxygenase SsuD/methylene tetrahydromethanopterin reductase-like flavin-dependent oxidoreductase (luciferase family)